MKGVFKKIFVLSALSVWFVLPVVVSAQANPAATPEPPKNTAENINVELKIPLPFVPTKCWVTDAAGKKLSPLVPAVCSLSDYLEGIYRLLIGTGALLAVVMIIIAGYQWMIAGGSADQAGSAKKRVWGASMGLVLALVSYVVLNAISSRLVDLNLPQIKPVQPFTLGLNNFCQSADQPPDNPNLLVKQAQASPHPETFLTPVGGGPSLSLAEAECNKKYNAGLDQKQGQCMGGLCPDGKNCIPVGGSRYECQRSLMFGHIDWRPNDGFITYLTLYTICEGEAKPGAVVAAFDVTNGAQAYKLPRYKELAASCLYGKKIVGYALKAAVQDDCYGDYFLGSLITDDDFGIGRSCSMPLSSQSTAGAEVIYKFDDIDWRNVDSSLLFQPGDLVNTARECNLVIDRTNFPVPVYTDYKGDPYKTSCPTRKFPQQPQV